MFSICDERIDWVVGGDGGLRRDAGSFVGGEGPEGKKGCYCGYCQGGGCCGSCCHGRDGSWLLEVGGSVGRCWFGVSDVVDLLGMGRCSDGEAYRCDGDQNEAAAADRTAVLDDGELADFAAVADEGGSWKRNRADGCRFCGAWSDGGYAVAPVADDAGLGGGGDCCC